MGCTLKTKPANVLHDRFPDHASEEPVEMVRGEVGDARQVIEFNRFVQVLLDIDENAENPFFIGLFGLPLHGVAPCCADKPAIRLRLPCLRIVCLTVFADFESSRACVHCPATSASGRRVLSWRGHKCAIGLHRSRLRGEERKAWSNFVNRPLVVTGCVRFAISHVGRCQNRRPGQDFVDACEHQPFEVKQMANVSPESTSLCHRDAVWRSCRGVGCCALRSHRPRHTEDPRIQPLQKKSRLLLSCAFAGTPTSPDAM